MTRVLRSSIPPQPVTGSIVVDINGTAWTRHVHYDLDRWYGCAPTDRGRPTMLARTWETLAASGDLTVLHEPAIASTPPGTSEWSKRAAVREAQSPAPFARIPDLTHTELDVVAEIAELTATSKLWGTSDVVAAYRRGIADGKARAA